MYVYPYVSMWCGTVDGLGWQWVASVWDGVVCEAVAMWVSACIRVVGCVYETGFVCRWVCVWVWLWMYERAHVTTEPMLVTNQRATVRYLPE